MIERFLEGRQSDTLQSLGYIKYQLIESSDNVGDVDWIEIISAIKTLTNLQELALSSEGVSRNFNQLQDVRFSHLKVLNFLDAPPEFNMIIEFLKINGWELEELYIE